MHHLWKPFSTLALLGGLLVPTLPAEDEKPAEQPKTEAKQAETPKKEVTAPAGPTIQLAILLDTSGSMDGLINQARTQLWTIVNDLATAQQGGKSPNLNVALYEYGKSSIPAEEGYLRQIVAFTDDLDKISEELFALATNGGDEYCGHVIQAATRGLQWSENEKDLKIMFVCGNEPFTQGSVNYKDACQEAVKKGIIINTIFCGDEAEGINTGWKDGALLAEGSFAFINQNQVVAAIETPFDKDITKLSSEINKTFLLYGEKAAREEAKKRQVEQDEKAAQAAPNAAAARAQFKSAPQYQSADRDLTSGIVSGKVKLNDIPEDQLPEELQKLKPEERQAYVDKLAKEREAIQKKIKELGEKRDAYIAEERKKQSEAEKDKALDSAVIESIRKQAAQKNYEFKK